MCVSSETLSRSQVELTLGPRAVTGTVRASNPETSFFEQCVNVKSA